MAQKPLFVAPHSFCHILPARDHHFRLDENLETGTKVAAVYFGHSRVYSMNDGLFNLPVGSGSMGYCYFN